MGTVKLFGIKNCDSMKKAFAWLAARDIAYEFHDYKQAGVPRERLLAWCHKLGWKALLNTRGSTWRKLSPEQQAAIDNQSKAMDAMLALTSLIRRPVVETLDGQILLGFDPTIFESSLH